MHKLMLTLTFLTSSISSSPLRDGPFLRGPCPHVSPMPGLDLSLYQGKWRQVALFPNVTSPLVGSGYRPDLACVNSSYNIEGAECKVTNTGVDTETQEQVIITGNLVHNQEGISLHLDSSDLPDEVYQVLDTDYETFASVWNCKEFPMLGVLVRREFAWIIGREEVMEATGRIPEGMLNNAVEAFSRFGIDVAQFELTESSSC